MSDVGIFICPVCEAVIEGDNPCPNGLHGDEFAALRSTLIEALWYSGRHGCGLDECTDTVACPACRADLGADVDAILDALGLERVGWRIPDEAGPDSDIIHDDSDVPHIDHDECEPIFRLAALSDRSGDAS